MKVSRVPRRGRSAKRAGSRSKRRERSWFRAGLVVLLSLAVGIVGGTSLADFVIGGVDPFYTDQRLSAPRPPRDVPVDVPMDDQQRSADAHGAPIRPDLLYGPAAVIPVEREDESFPEAGATEAWVQPQAFPSFQNRTRFGSSGRNYGESETAAEADAELPPAGPSATPASREP